MKQFSLQLSNTLSLSCRMVVSVVAGRKKRRGRVGSSSTRELYEPVLIESHSQTCDTHKSILLHLVPHNLAITLLSFIQFQNNNQL